MEPLGADLYKAGGRGNHGYLPTNLSDVALANEAAKPVRVQVSVTGGEVVMNPPEVAIGHLAGRNERQYPWSPWGQQWTAVAKPTEWLVRIPGGRGSSKSPPSPKRAAPTRGDRLAMR